MDQINVQAWAGRAVEETGSISPQMAAQIHATVGEGDALAEGVDAAGGGAVGREPHVVPVDGVEAERGQGKGPAARRRGRTRRRPRCQAKKYWSGVGHRT